MKRADFGPYAGHQFHFAVTVQGSYRIEGETEYHDSEPDPDAVPFTLTVRAWDLSHACQVAAQTPFGLWTHPGEGGDHA